MTALLGHLAQGATTIARCWRVTRRDGRVFGFTDHDLDLIFDGTEFAAGAGLWTSASSQTTGLSVDNTEASGALSHAAITEADILAGRYDGAEVETWIVNWADLSQRHLQFKGSIGEIVQAGGAFQAELRGLTERLNQPQGRVYQRSCSAVLADRDCRADLSLPGYRAECMVATIRDQRLVTIAELEGFEDRWFERGRLVGLSGAATGLSGMIKNDRITAEGRQVELWEAFRADLQSGDRVLLEAGCDRSPDSCRYKFNNFNNFRGFPHIPREDWVLAVPRQEGVNDGSSQRR